MRSTSKSSTRTHPPKVATSLAQSPAPVLTRRQSIRRYEALMQLVPDALVVVESTGHIRLVNRKTEELFGYSARELLGQPVELLVPEGLPPVLQRPEYADAPSLYPLATNLPLSWRRRDGTEFPIEAHPARLDEGDEALVIVSIHDISAYQWVHDAQVAAQIANQNLYALQALTDTALSHLSL